MIYFVRAGLNGPVKIGSTEDVEARIKNMQPGCPHELILVREVPGEIEHERAFQALFEEHRLRGEWFNWTDEMLTAQVSGKFTRYRDMSIRISQELIDRLNIKLKKHDCDIDTYLKRLIELDCS